MAKKRNPIDFDVFREVALELPDVEGSTTSRGTSLKVSGRLFACPAIHSSAEPDSPMVRVSVDERARLLEAEPRTFYVTEHYASYPAVLVRLSQMSRDSLRGLLEGARRFVVNRPRIRKTRAR
jgi:hypothetical protein